VLQGEEIGAWSRDPSPLFASFSFPSPSMSSSSSSSSSSSTIVSSSAVSGLHLASSELDLSSESSGVNDRSSSQGAGSTHVRNSSAVAMTPATLSSPVTISTVGEVGKGPRGLSLSGSFSAQRGLGRSSLAGSPVSGIALTPNLDPWFPTSHGISFAKNGFGDAGGARDDYSAGGCDSPPLMLSPIMRPVDLRSPAPDPTLFATEMDVFDLDEPTQAPGNLHPHVPQVFEDPLPEITQFSVPSTTINLSDFLSCVSPNTPSTLSSGCAAPVSLSTTQKGSDSRTPEFAHLPLMMTQNTMSLALASKVSQTRISQQLLQIGARRQSEPAVQPRPDHHGEHLLARRAGLPVLDGPEHCEECRHELLARQQELKRSIVTQRRSSFHSQPAISPAPAFQPIVQRSPTPLAPAPSALKNPAETLFQGPQAPTSLPPGSKKAAGKDKKSRGAVPIPFLPTPPMSTAGFDGAYPFSVTEVAPTSSLLPQDTVADVAFRPFPTPPTSSSSDASSSGSSLSPSSPPDFPLSPPSLSSNPTSPVVTETLPPGQVDPVVCASFAITSLPSYRSRSISPHPSKPTTQSPLAAIPQGRLDSAQPHLKRKLSQVGTEDREQGDKRNKSTLTVPNLDHSDGWRQFITTEAMEEEGVPEQEVTKEDLLGRLSTARQMLSDMRVRHSRAEAQVLSAYISQVSDRAQERIEAKNIGSQNAASTIALFSKVTPESKVEDVLRTPTDWLFSPGEKLSLATSLGRLYSLESDRSGDTTDFSSDEEEGDGDGDNLRYFLRIELTEKSDYDHLQREWAEKMWRAHWLKAQLGDIDQQIKDQEVLVNNATQAKRETLESLDTLSAQGMEIDDGNHDGDPSGGSRRTEPLPEYFARRTEKVTRKSRILPPPKPLNPFFHDILSFSNGAPFFFFSSPFLSPEMITFAYSRVLLQETESSLRSPLNCQGASVQLAPLIWVRPKGGGVPASRRLAANCPSEPA